jgi:hypothetical protein
MKRTLSGCLASAALATSLGLAAGACGSKSSGQLSPTSGGTFDAIALGKRSAERTFCAQLHRFEDDAGQRADADVVENDFATLASDAQSTSWSGVIQEAITQFQAGHMGRGYKVLATLDPHCR